MQFLVLFVGIMVFVFFLFATPPVHFNTANLEKVRNSEFATELAGLEEEYDRLSATTSTASTALVEALRTDDDARSSEAKAALSEAVYNRNQVAGEVDALITNVDSEAITVRY